MPAFYVLFALGVLSLSIAPQLLPIHYSFFALLLLALISLWLGVRGLAVPFSGRVKIGLLSILGLLLGLAWGNYSGQLLRAEQLNPALEGRDLLVRGRIQGLPVAAGERMRFTLALDEFAAVNANTFGAKGLKEMRLPSSIQLSWYAFSPYQKVQYKKSNEKTATLPELVPGQVWQLQVRLKRPRGLVNPAGFDYQAWLLRKGIGATGYVRTNTNNQCVNCSAPEAWLGLSVQVDQWRYALQQWLLHTSQSSEKGILVALLIGESTQVDKQQWLRMQQTGTSHLIAISGLHVGFLAMFGYALGLLLGRIVQSCWHRLPAQYVAYGSAIFFALGYSALAGFNIPTLRTFLMLALFYWLAIWRRQGRIVDIYCFALAWVVLLDPLAGFDMGFWLSFGAVGLLLLYFTGRFSVQPKPRGFSRLSLTTMFVGFSRSQWVMFVGLLVPLSVFINSVSLTAPLANFIAIPLVTFLVVPSLLLAATVHAFWPWLSLHLLWVAEQGMILLKYWLDWLLALAPGQLNPIVHFSPELAALMALSAFLVLLPRGLLSVWFGWLGLALGSLLTVLGPAHLPPLKITVLDVGQGTAVVVQAPDGTLVYDAGPRYSPNFEAGSAIVMPYLFSEGMASIDKLVLSHMDRDHVGGAESLLTRLKVGELLIGEQPRTADVSIYTRAQSCHGYPAWRWGEVDFQFLHWAINPRSNANNHSCVLLIRYKDQSILLPGDAEQEVEAQLQRNPELPKPLTVLLAGHHGSRTSSSAAFVAATLPEHVIYSTGFGNQHGHPHPLVQQRFAAIGAQAWNTATAGALQLVWTEEGTLTLVAYRQRHKRYWFSLD